VNSDLANLLLTQGSLKNNLEGVVRTISENESAAALWQWMDCCEKYVWIDSDQAFKSPEISMFEKCFVSKLFRTAHLIPITPRRSMELPDTV
jgi:hypothetical protein